VQARSEIMEKLVEVPVQGDSLRDFEKSLVLAVPEISSLLLNSFVVHRPKDIHRETLIQGGKLLLHRFNSLRSISAVILDVTNPCESIYALTIKRTFLSLKLRATAVPECIV
jgi:hypothetical protein